MKNLFIIFSLVLNSNLIFGGGLYIHENSLVFNGKQYYNSFWANEQVTMEFRYDNFVYGGKPYQYIVFKIYEYKNSQKLEPAKYFVTRAQKGSYRGRVTFVLNKSETRYAIEYHVLPYFANEPIYSNSFFLSDDIIKRIQYYYNKSGNTKYQAKLIEIETKAEIEPVLDASDIVLYFRNPSKIIEDLNNGKALSFNWYAGSESSQDAYDIKYSYRLDPIEDWSVFSSQQSANYYFLRPGDYTFEVKAEYKINNKKLESSIASYSINVKNQIFQVKDEIGLQNVSTIPDDFKKIEHYNNSRALLIGVSDYFDPKFTDLPFVKNDVKQMKNILEEKFEFEVETIVKNTSKSEIEEGLNNFFNIAEENDRLILYFSGHGTSIDEAGFIVPSDGQSTNKVNTCISYHFLSNWIDKLIEEKKIKHLLIVFDACQAGLGVFSKSDGELPIVEISKYRGAHMLTAGLLNQKAIADGNSSIFTKYLIKAVSGESDYNHDSVVTLTELMVFVQNNVSNYAKSRYGVSQTPMMGKIKGAGEMIFILNK